MFSMIVAGSMTFPYIYISGHIGMTVPSGHIGDEVSGAGVFFDMHDGDQKMITFDKGSPLTSNEVIIRPYANDQKWTVMAVWDKAHMNASINFNVPGKPNPPPVSLLLTWNILYRLTDNDHLQWSWMCEFTDPSSTIGDSRMPLNAWISAANDSNHFDASECPFKLGPL
jgi:hypothetical protein